jgi:hypothetical protein
MMSYKSVDEWLGEEENFSMRGERILALMSVSDISPPAMSESGAVSTNNPNIAHMKHAKDGENNDKTG